MTAERRRALLRWYRRAGRSLPWRGETDPYRVLVSEVMLQQTQAARVVPYYQRFIVQFPTVADLAAAPLRDVLAAWTGLGYNRRAKMLRDACRLVATRGWPTTVPGIQALPGVGPYTSAAIACFAFGQRVAAIDTNTRRVLSRWHGEALDGKALAVAARKELASDATSWNQAIMDLGNAVCTPRNPSCRICPVERWCAGPDPYRSPRSQQGFEGSNRQARGAVLRVMTRGGAWSLDRLAAATELDHDRVVTAVDGLVEDALLARPGAGRYALAD